jgi:hypothetical protein
MSGMGVVRGWGRSNPAVRRTTHTHARWAICSPAPRSPLEKSIGGGGSEHGLIERHDSSFGTSVRLMHGIPTQYIIGRTEDKRGAHVQLRGGRLTHSFLFCLSSPNSQIISMRLNLLINVCEWDGVKVVNMPSSGRYCN